MKTFHQPDFAALGMNFNPREEYFTVSHRNVVRGMHFQLPPHDHEKFVYCIRGAVLDVILDLRKGSGTFGKSASVELTALNRRMFFVPRGFAHGLLALADDSLVVCKTSTVHAPAHDVGVRWDSFLVFRGRLKNRFCQGTADRVLPGFADFNSPF